VDWIKLAQERKKRRALTDKQTNKYSGSIISIKEERRSNYLSELNPKLDYGIVSNF